MWMRDQVFIGDKCSERQDLHTIWKDAGDALPVAHGPLVAYDLSGAITLASHAEEGAEQWQVRVE